ncbi:hypothetical protein NLI96_g1179 [Meripilus lineatus]|uniref:Glycoside hydrolase family 76 protein n=1 Tax=Meripilus lineatus TaxID=2056292 RepID=A0AAD5VDB5_9APHY|nr:hypothetical protein NLI96_g1179 [Physisporinus lineatus]
MQGRPILSLWSAVVILSLFCLPSLSQDFSVPTIWRKPTSEYTRSELNDIAQGIIDSVAVTIDSTTGLHPDLAYPQNANMMVGIATHDALVAGSKNQGTVTGSLQAVATLNHLFWQTHQWSLAVQAAYRAYGRSDSLNLAMSIWDALSVYQITPENAASGTHPQKNTTFSQMCNGASTAGGVFRFPDNRANVLEETSVNGVSVCLSARLYEVTHDSKYAAAAELAAQFIMSQLYNGSIIQDTINLSNCSYNTGIGSYNTGFFIEGLSVYANVTQNSTWTTNLNKVLFTAINYPPLTRYDGVMIEDAKSSTTPTTFSNDFACGLKGTYIRGLFEMWTRSTDAKIKNFLQSYLFVQLNALLDLARLPGTNQFSSSWPGTYPLNLDACSQFAALDVFNAAIGLTPASNDTISSPPPETSLASSGSGKSTNVGLIVGVTIAAIVVLVALVCGFLWWRRRGRRPTELLSRSSLSLISETGNLTSTYAIEPFVAQSPTITSSPTPRDPHSEKMRPPPTQPNSHGQSDTSPQMPGGGPAPRSRAEKGTRLHQDPVSLTTAISNRDQPSSHSRAVGQSQGGNDVADPSQIPQLIHTLNQALARLPPALVDGENPPEYMTM